MVDGPGSLVQTLLFSRPQQLTLLAIATFSRCIPARKLKTHVRPSPPPAVAIARVCSRRKGRGARLQVDEDGETRSCATAYAEVALAAYRRGDLRQAKVEYAKASNELGDQSLPLLYNRALAHAADGELDTAIELLRIALALPAEHGARFEDGGVTNGHEEALGTLLEYSVRAGHFAAAQDYLRQYAQAAGPLERRAWLQAIISWQLGFVVNASEQFGLSDNLDLFERTHYWGHILSCSADVDRRLDQKDLLAESLRGAKFASAGRFGEQQLMPLHPDTYTLPEQRKELRMALQQPPDLWVLKPSRMADAHGVQFASSSRLKQLVLGSDAATVAHLGRRTVAQRYIMDPLLWEGKKFDLRLYVLVGAVRPPRLYLYGDGYARLAPENFTLENVGKDGNHSRDRRCHITNRSQHNKKKKRCARPLRELWRLLRSSINGDADWLLMWQRIQDLLARAFVLVLAQSDVSDFAGPCGKIYGVDILLDTDLWPHLLEVNRAPAIDSGAGCSNIRAVHDPLVSDVIQELLPAYANLISNNGGPRLYRLSKVLSQLPHASTPFILQQALAPVLAEKDILFGRGRSPEDDSLKMWTTLFPARMSWEKLMASVSPSRPWTQNEIAITEASAALLASEEIRT